MKQKTHEVLTFFVILLFLGMAFLLFLPEKTGEAAKNTALETRFRDYFLLSVMINYQTNNAIHQVDTEMQEHGRTQRPVQEYFKCDSLLKNIAQAKELRKEIMNEFDYLSEMNCFHQISEADLKKFKLLENQCRNPVPDPGLARKITQIYDYQKEALNSGCMKQTELFDILRTAQFTLIRQIR